MLKGLIVLFFIFFIIFFLNLGQYLDITKKPKKSDIIVSLGDDYSGSRLKKALELYKKGYSTSNKFIYTGRDSINKLVEASGSKKEYLLKNGIKKNNIIHIDKSIIINTMEEVFFIKKYMLSHNYKNVIYVTHPQHSRRVELLANLIANYKKDNLTLNIVSCEPSWWNKEKYYLNKTAFKVSAYESVKIIYNLLKYGTPLIYFTKYSERLKTKSWDNILKKLMINNNYDN